VEITIGSVRLAGRLTVPDDAPGVVVFVHGSGSSRHSPRNRAVASVLNQAGLGTLLFDLLTPEEERDRSNVFDIELLGERLIAVTRWLRAQPSTAGLPVGYFGASTGAAAALWAAATPGNEIAAVVSRGGRPDLAGARLRHVSAPTLLIVGGRDEPVLALNRDAAAQLGGESHLAIVPGATHLFEEPGTLMAAAELARDWFLRSLAAPRATDRAAPRHREHSGAVTVVACPACGVRSRVPAVSTGRPRCRACHTDLPWLTDATEADFKALLDTRLLVLIDLWAPWCAPCRAMGPAINGAARELAGHLKVVKVNVDDAPGLAARLGVQGIPTLLLAQDGRIVGRQVGALDHGRLVAWIRRVLHQTAA
jgi:thioredoxin